MWREAAKVFANTGNWIEFGSRVQRQHWSRGQCNIVDHRKLVSLINNDKKNKQRRVYSWRSWSGTVTWRSGGFPCSGARPSRGSWRLRTWKKSTCGGKKKKKGNQDLCSFVHVLKCSLAMPGELRVWLQPCNNIQHHRPRVTDQPDVQIHRIQSCQQPAMGR